MVFVRIPFCLRLSTPSTYTMGKPRTASATSGGSGSDDLLHQIKEAMKDDNVVAHLAERIAAIVTGKITARFERLEKALPNKDTKINQLRENFTQLPRPKWITWVPFY